jgi:hypothetical protein
MAFNCLGNLLHVPPGGWKYTQSQSGFEIAGGDYYDLREKVRKHRQLNNFVTGPELDAEIQEQLCAKMEPAARAGFCRDCHPSPDTRALNLEDVKHFLKVAAGWIRTPTRFVSQLEATRRAEICASCPKNLGIAGCHSCHNLVKWTIELIGHRSTPFDSKLGACEVCGCGNQAQVHLPLEVLANGITPEMEWPSFCWKAAAKKPVSHSTPEPVNSGAPFGQ